MLETFLRALGQVAPLIELAAVILVFFYVVETRRMRWGMVLAELPVIRLELEYTGPHPFLLKHYAG